MFLVKPMTYLHLSWALTIVSLRVTTFWFTFWIETIVRDQPMTMARSDSDNRGAGARSHIIAAVAIAFLASCTSDFSSLALTSAPELVENPSGRVPLAAAIRFAASTNVSIELDVSDGTNSWSQSFDVEQSDEPTLIPVVGMRPGRQHQINLTIVDPDGDSYHAAFRHRTPPLPANPREFPPISVSTSEADRMEPGVTFLSVRRRALARPHRMTAKQKDFSVNWGMLVALDPAGEVIWYYESDSRTSGIDRLHSGNILMHRSDSATTEIDMLGNVVRQIYAKDRPFPPPDNPDAIPIEGMQTLHHQPHEMPNGNFLAFSANGYLIEDYPTSETDPDAPVKDQMVMADTVVEISPEGKIVWSWNSMDHLDPYRIGYDTFWSYWWVRGFDQHLDWTHANGLSYDESDDSVLVSFRNQSAIVKIDRASDDIKWILGRHDNWPDHLQEKLLKPVGDLMWPGYQHNPRMTPAGTVILFDNRAHGGAMPFEQVAPLQTMFSRAVEYKVDEEDMTVEQVWTTGDSQGEDPCFSYAMSDAWRLPKTDNRLVIFAFCTPLAEGVTQDIMDHSMQAADELPYGGRVVEYSGNDVVFRADIVDEHDMMQWEVYGGFRSPSIY